MYIKTLTVSELSSYIKKVIDSDFILGNTLVKGEISNFKIHSSGHIYFSLKDDYGKINCIMFKAKAENLKFIPENGMGVVVKGKVSVYPKDGAYQLYCDEITLLGIGELSAAFERLKVKLETAGLFDASHKKPIPRYIKNIGVVTSPTGAAIKDIINVTQRRNKGLNIKIYPALVQGANAPASIIEGIKYLNSVKDIEVIILARGGGSIEELWCFNDEQLAYAIYNSKKPIISAVGHEIDFTISDFVSDLRAPTPSAGAEIVSFSLEEANKTIESYVYLLNKIVTSYIENKYDNLDALKKSLQYNSPMAYIANSYNEVDRLKNIINSTAKNRIELEKERLSKLNALLSAHNPLNVLNKGYAILENDNNEVISEINKLKESNKIKITLKDGSGRFYLDKIQKGDENGE